jgi:hypothetical protein
MTDLIMLPTESENLTEEITKVDIFKSLPDLLNYRKYIWEDRPEKWLPPIIEEKWRTPDLDWVFDLDKKEKKIVPYFQMRGHQFVEPHLTTTQYANYLNRIELDIPLEHTMIESTGREFDAIYDSSDRNWKKFMESINSDKFNITKSIFGK